VAAARYPNGRCGRSSVPGSIESARSPPSPLRPDRPGADVAGQPAGFEQPADDNGKQVDIPMNVYKALSKILLACALACALGVGVAALGSSSSSSVPRTPALAAFSSSTESVITANWIAFFNPKTPVDKRISLLQDGQEFATIIKSQASSALAAQASVKVTKVTLVSATQAKVTYTIYESGKPALSNQTGIAVLQNGTWKVGIASFCSLLALDNGGKTSTLPPACKAAS
jgi:hypothetical protein